MSTPSPSSTPSTPAAACGYYDREFTLCATFEPKSGTRLPVVHFRYVPLTPSEMQERMREMENATRRNAVRLSVTILAKQLRAWTLRKPDGEIADCRNAPDLAAHVDNNIVEGICTLIMDSASSDEAEIALSDFPKP